MKLYKCDGINSNGNECQKATSTTEFWLTIGSDDNSLFIKNNLPEVRLLEMNKHTDIHFCSKECFINRFFMVNITN